MYVDGSRQNSAEGNWLSKDRSRQPIREAPALISCRVLQERDNNAADFESFRSAIWTRTRTVPQCGSAGVAPVCIAGMKLANPELVSNARPRATDAVNLQNGSSSALITSIRCHPETRH